MTVVVLYDVPFCSTDSGEYTLYHSLNILLTKTTAAQNEVTLSYYNVRGLYVLAVVGREGEKRGRGIEREVGERERGRERGERERERE